MQNVNYFLFICSNFLVLTSTDGNVLFIISATTVLLTDGLNAQAL